MATNLRTEQSLVMGTNAILDVQNGTSLHISPQRHLRRFQLQNLSIKI